ncbi:cysteine hydrolase [Actinomadura sp. DC4]|uniref:cysteine hydrolase n=1 Tax=Actinomadura sp. DC4 TaxID=3055069 RepID=UPI0025B1C30B|nr:cysteine hydrolase [Actinomadura sp. DC4]MDN3354578.1 cysteine hydrolase [Actinomadura sp. DC4]
MPVEWSSGLRRQRSRQVPGDRVLGRDRPRVRCPHGILKGVVDGNAFVKGSWGAAIIDELAPADGDIVIEGKRGLDTFASTNLDFILRSKGITTIALGGFLTNCCIESTMRSGYENGYRVVTLSDCLAATSVEEHDNALKYDFPMFSQPMPSAAFTGELGGWRRLAGSGLVRWCRGRFAAVVERVLDQCQHPAGHEARGAYGGARASHLGHLDDAAPGDDLDPPPRACGRHLVRPRRLAGIDHDFDPVALHDRTLLRTSIRLLPR